MPKVEPEVLPEMFFPVEVELAWLLIHIKDTQPVIFRFADWYMSCIPRHDAQIAIRTMYAALAPHFLLKKSGISTRISAKSKESVRKTYFEDEKTWRHAHPDLHQRLNDRGVYKTSVRRCIHDELARELFPNLKFSDRPIANAETLFLAVWEMEARQLESKGKAITP